jgi:hypothetical protein
MCPFSQPLALLAAQAPHTLLPAEGFENKLEI